MYEPVGSLDVEDSKDGGIDGGGSSSSSSSSSGSGGSRSSRSSGDDTGGGGGGLLLLGPSEWWRKARRTATHSNALLTCVARSLLLALAALQDVGVSHRDVKPDNVMLSWRCHNDNNSDTGDGSDDGDPDPCCSVPRPAEETTGSTSSGGCCLVVGLIELGRAVNGGFISAGPYRFYL